MRNQPSGRRLGAAVVAVVAAAAVGATGPATPAPASAPASASVSSSPQCHATTEGGYPTRGRILGSCVDGNGSWSYVIHGACTGPEHGYAVTAGPTLTTNSLNHLCPTGPTYVGSTPWVIQVAVYTAGTPAPPHPDPFLTNFCWGGECPY